MAVSQGIGIAAVALAGVRFGVRAEVVVVVVVAEVLQVAAE